jgi:hypothetical protein
MRALRSKQIESEKIHFAEEISDRHTTIFHIFYQDFTLPLNFSLLMLLLIKNYEKF